MQTSISSGEFVGKVNTSKSGSLLFFSSDDQYVFKTLHDKELEFLRTNILKNYVRYLEREHNSLLVQFVGVYKCKKNLIIVMKNIKNGLKTNETYDMKGSTYDRKVNKLNDFK